MTLNKKRLLIALILTIPVAGLVSAENKSWKINSDSSTMDITSRKATYIGRAKIRKDNITINGEKITAQKTAEGEFKFFDIIGQPASFHQQINNTSLVNKLSANKINYQLKKKLIFAKEHIRLKKVEQAYVIDIVGDELYLNQLSGYHLTVSGKPLTLHINQTDQPPVKVEADKLDYNEKTEIVELTGNVFLSRQQETIKAAKLIYNIKTGILNMPKTSNEQIEIIQSKTNKK
ncbi:LptA/OstA family protein [Aliikangiella sp. IMCC44359]|uniref:LptA/OstA family protein n=1 Tax=Aliikangiella sp. IMCC44359 TaxID=3459125 RepID=UPI00403B2BDE